jgi:hypothetical protein
MYDSERENEQVTYVQLLTLVVVLCILTILAYYSAKGFCRALDTPPTTIPMFFLHSCLQTLSGGPIGLYGIVWYITKP